MLMMLACFAVGVMTGVVLMCLMFIARDDVVTKCTGNCNQGGACTCWKARQRFDEELA